MENLNHILNEKSANKLIPLERRKRDQNTIGNLDNLQFFRTPNGSFFDPDDEYFNRHGLDIHGGTYSKEWEYIPGPDWLSEIGCYPEEKDKYENMDVDEDEGEPVEDDSEMRKFENEFMGDFEEDYVEGEEPQFDLEELKRYQTGDTKMIDQYLAKSGYMNMGMENLNINLDSLNINNTQFKKKKVNFNPNKNKNKKKQLNEEDDEGWETVEEDDEEF